MNRILLLTALAATALSACDKSDHTIVAGSKEDNSTVNAAAVVLPPAIASSQSYRCKDNSVAYIDWLDDQKTADISAKKGGPATRVVSAEAGMAMTAEGYSLTGTKDSTSVTLERPGKGSQNCKA
ncbi:MAG: hypothetical protein ABIO85_05940 [Sphingomicrobium sp.]